MLQGVLSVAADAGELASEVDGSLEDAQLTIQLAEMQHISSSQVL
jgi:hypothetical protein